MHRPGQGFHPCERRATDDRSRFAGGSLPRDRGREWQAVLTIGPSSHSDRRKEYGEDAIEHDDQKDRLDHRDGGLLAQGFRAALDPQSLAARNDANHQRHERRLDHSDLEVRHRHGFMKPCDEYRRAHPAVEPRDQASSVESGHRANEGENRKRQHQGYDAREDQDFNGIEAHGGQRVDFLAHFHRAEFGGVGAARPSRDHDGDNEDANLAEYEDADQVDDVGIRAEFAKMEDALLGDDGADQKGDQSDDRYGLPADL